MTDQELAAGRPNEKAVIVELFLLSVLSLFFELLVVRWMSADLRAFTVFRTFPLISCFVGLGLGFALRRDDIYKLFFPSLFFFALLMIIGNFVGICYWGFPSLANFQWQNLVHLSGEASLVYVLAFCITIVLYLNAPFAMHVAMGSRLGVLFNSCTPLRAYNWNVLGAVIGSILMPTLCFFGLSPLMLLAIGSVGMLLLQLRTVPVKTTIINAVLMLLLIPASILLPQERAVQLVPEYEHSTTNNFEVLWSPYQRIDLVTMWDPAIAGKVAPQHGTVPVNELAKKGFLGLELGVNRAFYQFFFSNEAITQSFLAPHLVPLKQDYSMVFHLNKPQSALIVGAGTGQNVSSAVETNIASIDAVEIDPMILETGRLYNPDYHHPTVNLVCDDARHFFNQCQKKYDIIDFSTLDSHAVSGLGSSVRVDIYIYTVESIKRALTLLNPDGVLVCTFATIGPTTKDRLYETFTQAAGYEPLCYKGNSAFTIFILGEGVRNGTLKTLPLLSTYKPEIIKHQESRILTDDWPYLYVRTDVVDYPYLLVVGIILALSVYATRKVLFSNKSPRNWQMFFLGAAFMLLELHAITFLALLFGATWLTSAVAISGILIMIWIANMLVLRHQAFFASHPNWIYIGLLLTVLLNYVLPSDLMISLDAAKHLIPTLIVVLPISFAALVFSNGFNKSENNANALAFNLFGAVVGGALEYVSSYTGIRSVLLLSLLFYGLSWFFARKASTLPLATEAANQ